ncbi:MAG TPA: hypothetical protein VKA63_05915 [Candidatus Krumholzibacteria bacterium]|nr:hypothetical protein [Candidatus Krumholzibacteria bacterium]
MIWIFSNGAGHRGQVVARIDPAPWTPCVDEEDMANSALMAKAPTLLERAMAILEEGAGGAEHAPSGKTMVDSDKLRALQEAVMEALLEEPDDRYARLDGLAG